MKSNRHTAIAKCKACDNLIISSGGGRFRTCSKCKESFVDQERWSGIYVRLSGAELIEQICPAFCTCRGASVSFGHSGNKHFGEFQELKDYMSKTYKVKWSEKKQEWI